MLAAPIIAEAAKAYLQLIIEPGRIARLKDGETR
jgi:hypothetical protein